MPDVRLEICPEVGKDQLGGAEMALQGLWRGVHAQDRQRRQEAGRVPRLAPVEVEAGGHAGRRQDVPQEDGVNALMDDVLRG